MINKPSDKQRNIWEPPKFAHNRYFQLPVHEQLQASSGKTDYNWNKGDGKRTNKP